jgi:hypothetical protein
MHRERAIGELEGPNWPDDPPCFDPEPPHPPMTAAHAAHPTSPTANRMTPVLQDDL